MTESENEYKYKVPWHVFMEAIKVSNEEFEELANDFATHGIRRLTATEINKLHPGLIVTYIGKPRFTLVEGADIQPNSDNPLEVSNLMDISTLVLVNCKFPDTKFTNIKRNDSLLEDNSNQIICLNTEFRSLSIINSDFYGLEFKNVKCGFFSLHSDVKVDYIQFINCSSNASIFITQDCKVSVLYFDGLEILSVVIESSVVETLELKETLISNSIHCRDSTKLDNIKVKDKSSVGVIHLDRSSCKEISINQSNVSEITIKESSTVSKLLFKESKVFILTVIDSEINTIEGLRNIKIKYLEFFNSVIKTAIFDNLKCDFHFTKSNFSELSISNSNLGILNIGPNSNFNAYIIDSDVRYLLIKKVTITENSSLSLSNVTLHACVFEETDILGRAHFRNISPLQENQLTPSDFDIDFSFDHKPHSHTYDEIQKIESSLFRISYSSLGTTEFIDCNLSKYDSFQFNNSRITEIFISGGTLPHKNISVFEATRESISWFEQMVSLFNQFSNVFQSQGHIFQSVDYRSRSNYYQHELLKAKKDTEKKWLMRVNNWFERIPFFWNKWSSNYGANWAQALTFTIAMSLLCYLSILYFSDRLFQTDMVYDESFIGYYFDFLNPLRPFDFCKQIGLEINGWTRFIDLLSRVVIGYGIYQLIAAFRRYGRK